MSSSMSPTEPNKPDAAAEIVPLDRTTPQFTLRAVLTGMVLGAALSMCNVYTGLTVGWSFNMSITAALLSYAFWMTLHGVSRDRFRSWTMYENNINQTAASSAAAVSSAGLVAPVPALAMMTGFTPSYPWLALWIFAVCLVGISVAIGLRRQMILVDKLPFPSGVATAEMLREMHAHGQEAFARVRMMLVAGGAACVIKLLETYKWTVGFTAPYLQFSHTGFLPFSIQGFTGKSLTFSLDPTLMMVGVGGLIGLRAAVSMLVGAVLAWLVIAPPLIHSGHIRLSINEPLEVLPAEVTLPPEPQGYASYSPGKRLVFKGIMSRRERDELLAKSGDAPYQAAVRALYTRSQQKPTADVPQLAANRAQPSFGDLGSWLLWPGVSLMVVSSLVSFGFSAPSLARSLLGKRDAATEGRDPADVPFGLFLAGMIFALVLASWLQMTLFGVALWMAVIGVLLSFALALVAGRVSGETNTTPVGAMGKVTQLLFGVIAPGQPAANLMTANVTGGAASQCADLLHDLKTGHLIGAAPRLQAAAQVCGAFAGSIVGTAIYLVMIQNPREQLMTATYPAPAVAMWKAVAELFQVGLAALPQGAAEAALIAALVGVLLPVLEKTLPAKAAGWVPSASAVGLAFVINAYNSLSMFIGAVIAACVGRFFPAWSKRFLTATCAGIIAGESLTGVGISLDKIIRDAWAAATAAAAAATP